MTPEQKQSEGEQMNTRIDMAVASLTEMPDWPKSLRSSSGVCEWNTGVSAMCGLPAVCDVTFRDGVVYATCAAHRYLFSKVFGSHRY